MYSATEKGAVCQVVNVTGGSLCNCRLVCHQGVTRDIRGIVGRMEDQ